MRVHWCGRDDRSLRTAAMDLCERTGQKSTRMRAWLAQGIAQLAVARDGPRLLGFATVNLRPAEHFARVDYIATAPEARRTGVATAVLEFVRDEAQRSFDTPGARYDVVVVELEPDQEGFFGRRGARRLAGVDYEFPANPPIPLSLMAIPVRPGRDLPRPYMERLLTALFQLEGRAPGDPLLTKLIAKLPAKAALEALPQRAVRAERELVHAGRRFRLRPYRPDDFDAVREHDLEAALQETGGLREEQLLAFREAWLEGRKHDLERPEVAGEPGEVATLLVLADEQDRYAGHIWWEPNRDPIAHDRTLWIQSLAVAREHRRQGWAGVLLEEAAAEAKALKLPRLGLSVSAANAAGRALYEKCGFRPRRLTMEKDLS